MITPIRSGPPATFQTARPVSTKGPPNAADFAAALDQAVEASRKLAFSAHARQRLAERNIVLRPPDMARLEKAVHAASLKGAQESLVIMDALAFVVSVPNRTVITVLSPVNGEETVITQIDSAVVVGHPSQTDQGPGPDPLGGSPIAAD